MFARPIFGQGSHGSMNCNARFGQEINESMSLRAGGALRKRKTASGANAGLCTRDSLLTLGESGYRFFVTPKRECTQSLKDAARLARLNL